MSRFISPYDREFENMARESDEAYERGKQNILKKLRLEIEGLEHYEIRGEVTPLVNVERVLEIIDKHIPQ